MLGIMTIYEGEFLYNRTSSRGGEKSCLKALEYILTKYVIILLKYIGVLDESLLDILSINVK